MRWLHQTHNLPYCSGVHPVPAGDLLLPPGRGGGRGGGRARPPGLHRQEPILPPLPCRGGAGGEGGGGEGGGGEGGGAAASTWPEVPLCAQVTVA